MNLAYIGLGSNLGDGKRTLQDAWNMLDEMPGVHAERISNPYLTAPVDMTSQHWFTNAIGILQTDLAPDDLLATLLDVETYFGRKKVIKSFGYQDRSIDLDLLYYGNIRMDTPELTLPHPRVKDRLFVLVPLAELVPDFVDTVSGKPITEMENALRERIGTEGRKQQEIIRGSWDEQ